MKARESAAKESAASKDKDKEKEGAGVGAEDKDKGKEGPAIEPEQGEIVEEKDKSEVDRSVLHPLRHKWCVL